MNPWTPPPRPGYQPAPGAPQQFPQWQPGPQQKKSGSGKIFGVLLVIFALFSGCSGAVCVGMVVSPNTKGTAATPGDKVIVSTPAAAMDKKSTPAKSFVTVKSDPDLDMFGTATLDGTVEGYLFTVKGQRHLVVYVPVDDPIAAPVKKKEKSETLVFGALHELTGRIYDGGEYGGASIPSHPIYLMATKDLKCGEQDVRVLHVGEKPDPGEAAKPPPTKAEQESTAAMATGSAVFWFVAMLVAGGLGIFLLVRKPKTA